MLVAVYSDYSNSGSASATIKVLPPIKSISCGCSNSLAIATASATVSAHSKSNSRDFATSAIAEVVAARRDAACVKM